MAYVFEQSRKDGPAFTAMYKAENGRYRSAGTYDVRERAQEVAEESEQHARLRLAETSPADRATVTIREFAVKFLREHPVEPNTKQTYAQLLNPHVLPYIGGRRVAEISRETVHRLLTVVLPEAEASQVTVINTRTCLSAMMQMAWDHGYRKDNPVQGIRLKRPPRKSIVVATTDQFGRVYKALPHESAKVFARLGVASGARYCELISFVPEDFDFGRCMLSVNKSTVEVSAEFHPDGYRFLTRAYTKNGEHRRFKLDAAVCEMVRQHIAEHSIGPGQIIFPIRLFATRKVGIRPRLSEEEIEAFGFTEPLPSGRVYRHGTLGGYVTAGCRCEACGQWSADYGRDRKRRKTGRSEREWSAGRRRDPTEYMGKHSWRRIWNKAVEDAGLPFAYTPYQVRHTHASWLIDQGVDIERVRTRLGHGDLTTTTRYVKILDEEDSAAADVMGDLLKSIA
ncbi:MAG TPA: tyrosine-type recombinase/integrase [Streptosporangiaceae bacterium]|nr:tyrosine-type recombinase/integrase [Streptosporangiaceae bacterium]